ncbi:hypothetical protein D1007_30639 [Hordeum vulgare]|nr:hypothetical protein D1007_30639 [Hordeum vulgare]
MADSRHSRAECYATRVAQMAPAGPAGARWSSSTVVNAVTGPDAREKHGSSQTVTKHPDGRTATPSLARASKAASQARPEIPHNRHTLAMATELLRYQPTPDHHDDWL